MYYQKTAPEVLEDFKTSAERGLSQDRAKKLLVTHGGNIILREKKTPLIFKFASFFVDLFALLLVGAAAISFIFGGETGPRDALVIIGIVVLNATIGFIQEYRAEKIIEALQKVLPKKTVVLRGGKEVEILASEVVPGDILILDEGDDIPADGRIIEENELETNDFTLTGESIPQPKFSNPIKKKVALTDRDDMVYAGTSIAKGDAKIVVTATGMNTEFGKIAQTTQRIEDEQSPLQKELTKTAKKVAKITVAIGVLIFVINILLQKPFSFSLVLALSLAVAMVPEGLPATVSVALALAVKRMAKRKALIKKLSAVETLGCTTVICSDKTGTITKNEMTVKEIWADFKDIHVKGIGYEPAGDFLKEGKELKELPETLEEVLIGGVLCTNAKLIQPPKISKSGGVHSKISRWTVLGDPTEGALITLSQKANFFKKDLEKIHKRVCEIPFTSERKKMTVITKSEKDFCAYSKGAPREILDCCSFIKIGNSIKGIDSFREKILCKVDEFAKKGLRVLAVTKRDFSHKKEEIPMHGEIEKRDEKRLEKNMIFLGLVAMIDPPKEGIKEAVVIAKKAGIKITMITGDYGLTAAAIAQKVGIVEDNYSIITGTDLLKLKDQELVEILRGKDVIFARTSPEQKIKIVSLYKDQGEIVAVTGDGVNDAPALKKADIGVAMGIAGTDVSKEASEVILLDDNFKTIVSAVEEGRVVYDNLKKVVHYIFSSNVGELFSVIGGIVLGIPIPILAIQILAVDLGTDVLPSVALAVDPKEQDVMERSPRSQKERLLNKKIIIRFFYIGIIMGLGAVLSFTFMILKDGWFWGQEISMPLYLKACTVTYASLVFSQVVNTFSTHAGKASIFKNIFTNLYTVAASLSSIMLLFAFMYIPIFQNFLETRPVGVMGLLLALSVGLLCLILVEIKNFFQRKRIIL